MKAFFKELFEYSHHYNRMLVEVYTNYPDKVSERAVKLYNHILNAHQVWNSRIEPDQKKFGIWEIHALQDYITIDQANFNNSLFIIDKYELSQIVAYANSNGQIFHNSIRDILFQVINHSTYHRAQIATEFKQQGLEPLLTDYIVFKR